MNPRPILAPLSVLYGAVTALRNWSYDVGLSSVVDVRVPVISIGNLTAGGSGKTPVVRETVRTLMKAGLRTAVVSRGYGRETTGLVVVSDGNNVLVEQRASGDEPMMIARSLPDAIVIVDEDRVRGAETAVKNFGAQVIVLDDGFQHRRIHRMKDIVLMDAGRMPQETMLLPAGYRRESMNGLKRANAVLVTKCRDEEEGKTILRSDVMENVPHRFSSSFVPSSVRALFGNVPQSLEIVKGRRVTALCGIASPESFRRSLTEAGAVVADVISVPDHRQFTSEIVRQAVDSMHRTSSDFLVTTEKDAVRLQQYKELLTWVPVMVLLMEVRFHQPEAWKGFLLEGVVG